MARAKPIVTTTSAQLVPVGQPAEVGSINFTGFTDVKLFNGNGSGTLLVEVTTAGVFQWDDNLLFNNGLFATVTGTGSLTVWVV